MPWLGLLQFLGLRLACIADAWTLLILGKIADLVSGAEHVFGWATLLPGAHLPIPAPLMARPFPIRARFLWSP